ncbi:MAG TPA: TIGR03085 family metal-binding protein [Actinocrinis sp.]|nr:TIGR03085 family metal-binding protein [Actinocrinis sp.]
MSGFARIERGELADTLVRVGPDAPTLCTGWSAADLAAHLVVRDGRPDAALGIIVKPLAGWHEKVVASTSARTPFADLIRKVRGGPPAWSPVRLRSLDEAVNTIEYFVHHEDLRRGVGDEPRELDPALSDALWSQLRRGARLMFRAVPVGVTLVRTESRDTPRQTVVAKAATPQMVTVSGPAGELLMFAHGRKQAARVELTGDDAAILKLRNAKLGL